MYKIVLTPLDDGEDVEDDTGMIIVSMLSG